MNNEVIDSFTFEDHGREFEAEIFRDDMGPPWEEHDGHGPVSEWRLLSSKRPGERILSQDRLRVRFYDTEEAQKIALRDGWGLDPQMIATLTEGLGRAPTQRERAAIAVERDFQRMRGWCNDDWCWVTVHVTDVLSGDDDYLGGVESDGNYWKECAREMAEGLHPLAEAHEAANLELCTD